MGRQIVTAEDFWSRFAEKLRNKIMRDEEWEEKYKSNKRWTKFIYELLGDDIKNEYKYNRFRECSTEYLRTDMGFYDISKRTEGINSKYDGFEWDFDIAIEHENDETAWLDEFVKLVHINCGLKVLISYHHYSTNNGIPKEPDEILEVAEKIYNSRKYKNLNDNWIIILGPCFNDMINGKDFVAYKSTIENGEIKFSRLENKSIIY